MSHLIYYFLFTVENVIKWSLVPWRSPFRHILAPSERFFPFLVKDSCRGFIEKGTHFLWISPTVQHSNKTGNSYFTSLFVDNDLTYPKVSITCHGLGFICHACFPFFFFNGWGGGGGGLGEGWSGRWSFVVIIEANYSKTFCWGKSAFVSIMLSRTFAIKKKDKTKVRKVWIKSHTSHEPNM